MLAAPTPAVGLIKTISRTKEGSLLYHPTRSATDTVPEGHSCQGLALLRWRRWIYQPPTAGDECLSGTTASNELLNVIRSQPERVRGLAESSLVWFLIYLLAKPVVQDAYLNIENRFQSELMRVFTHSWSDWN